MTRLLLVGLLLALAVTTASPVDAVEWPNRRQGIVLGLNLGAGSGQIRRQGVDEAREFGGAGAIRMAYGLNTQWLLGVEFNGWAKADAGTRRSFATTTAAVTWFPKGGNFYLRGGAGSGNASLRVDAGGGQFFLVDEWGFAMTLALGYEFRISRTMALGGQLDTSYIDVGFVEAGNFAEQVKVNWQGITLSLNIYLY